MASSSRPVTLPSTFAHVRFPGRAEDILERSLAALILCFGLWTILNTGFLVVRSYSPVLFWDHWDIVRELMRHNDRITWSELWAQHNEHRPVTGRLLYFADFFWFHGRNVSLLVETFFVQFIQLLILSSFIWRSPSLRLPVRITLIGFSAFCCFSPLQLVNFIWAFQIHFVLGGFFGIVAVVLATEFYRRYGEGGRHSFLLFNLACCAALLAEFSLASGLLTWPVLLLLLVVFRLPLRYRISVASAGGIAIALYFLGYHSPEPLQLWDALSHPMRLIRFVSSELAWSWFRSIPTESTWPHPAHLLVVCVLLGVLGFLLEAVLRPKRLVTPLIVFLTGALLFTLGAIALTALGRSRYGLVQAIEGRYQTMVLSFWAMCALMAFNFLGERFPRERKLSVVAQVVMLFLLISTVRGNASMAEWGMHWRINQRLGWNAVIHNPPDKEFARLLFPDFPGLMEAVRHLQNHGWGPRGPIPSDFRIKPGEHAQHLPRGYTAQTSGCGGVVDGADGFERSRVHLWGWAYESAGTATASRVVIADSQGRIVQNTSLQIPRPDVPAALPLVTISNAGWQTDMSFEHRGTYFAFALDDRTHQVCALQNGINIR